MDGLFHIRRKDNPTITHTVYGIRSRELAYKEFTEFFLYLDPKPKLKNQKGSWVWVDSALYEPIRPYYDFDK